MERVANIFTELGGTFCISPDVFREKSRVITAFIFDWDGVFNDGTKDANGSSSFGEVDAMGANLLRYSTYLRHGEMPLVALMSGATNNLSFQYGRREHVHEVYYNVKNKSLAFDDFIRRHGLEPGSVAFFFDDVLDLSLAASCGLRIMISRKANPLFRDYVIQKNLADYVTANPGGSFAIREACEMLMGVNGNYDEVITARSTFSESYASYLRERENIDPGFYTWDGDSIVAGSSEM